MGKFEINTDKAGKFRFNLKANNGQVILASQGYASKSGCENGIDSVRKNSQNDDMFDRCTAKNGSPYFCLKASNGQVIGNSEMYSSTSAMENGIASVRKNAPDASVVDNSN
ncbi:MAG: YegP family protein [bacterium]